MCLSNPVQSIIMWFSGACYLAGTILLAKSVRFITKDYVDEGMLNKSSIKESSSSGYLILWRFNLGLILSTIGYIALIVSTTINF